MNIELLYWIIFSFIFVDIILTYTRKMSLGIGIIGIGAGFIAVYLFAPYMNLVIMNIGQAIFYGGDYTTGVILGIIHLIILAGCVIVRYSNLLSSGGKIGWA